MTTKKVIMFDLDGTLSDPKDGILRSVDYALNQMGIQREGEELLSFIGPPLQDSFKDHFSFTENEVHTAISHYRERYQALGKYENTLYPDVELMLNTLKEVGYRLAVATSKPTVFANDILAHFKLETYFDCVVGSELDGTRSDKGEVISYALSLLQVKPEDVVMIGDRVHDIAGAQTCGVDSIAVSYGYGSEEELAAAGATHRVNGMNELLNLLVKEKQLNSIN